jgi:diacylglycerol kinase (ATP)
MITGEIQTTASPLERPPRRCLILANPKAGGISSREHLWGWTRRCLDALHRRRPDAAIECVPETLTMLAVAAAKAGIQANVEAVPPPEDLPGLIRSVQSEGFDTIVAAGGDGTIHSVAQALVGSPLRLGILPMGTANNVARMLGLPFDLPAAMKIIAEGQETRIDVGRVAHTYFLEAAGVGLFADAFAAFGKDEPRKNQIGRLLRVIGPLFWNPPVRNLQLTLDGVVEKDEAIWISISNGAFLGDKMELAPGAHISDGLFDVIIVGAMNRRELLQFAIALRQGRHLELPKVRRVHARTVELRRVHRSHHPLPIHADAEIVAYTPALLEIVPGALCVLTPVPKP